MIPAGYMAKRVEIRPEWLKASQVVNVFSLSNCVSADFADYTTYWKHNGFWLFDSPQIIRAVAQEHSFDLGDTSLFYYEVHELEWHVDRWNRFQPDGSFATKVVVPGVKRLEGFDVATFYARNMPECSPLSCNHLAEEVMTNSHCLIETFEQAEKLVGSGGFNNTEPGPYRIFSVYSVDWP
jgi:hypothetical protein